MNGVLDITEDKRRVKSQDSPGSEAAHSQPYNAKVQKYKQGFGIEWRQNYK